MSDLPQAIAADPDGVQVALRAAHTLWSRGDTAESLKWLRKAAESASDEGADLRSLQLAKAAAELRAKLFGGSESAARSTQAAYPGAAGPASAPSVAPGESGSHPIAQLRTESEIPRAANLAASISSVPPIGAFAVGAVPDENAGLSSRPVTATQYPSHRPRQRMGLSSAAPGAQRDPAAYASVPSWSADSERRGSSAPPPLPRANLDDYEELEAEPDDEPADDPGSVWSSSGPESWRPPEPRSASPAATPPPLPPRGAFADDDGDFTQQQQVAPRQFTPGVEAHAVALPSLEENPPFHHERQVDAGHGAESHAHEGGAERAHDPLAHDPLVHAPSDPGHDPEPYSTREPRHGSAPFGVQSNAWDQQSRMPSWDHDAGSAWAAEHRGSWGTASSPDSSTFGNGASLEALQSELAPQSETARAKLTARVHHQAVRVSFAPDVRVPGQFVVRPLREGERAGSGERVALLVALEPGMPLV